jgi:hydrogenase-4 component F
MSRLAFDALSAVLVIPLGAAALLALLPGYRVTARLNMLASLLTFVAALSLLVTEWPPP